MSVSVRGRKASVSAVRVVVSLLIALAAIFPIYWMLITAIRPSSQLLSPQLALFPDGSATLEGFIGLFTQNPALTWLANSTLITLGSTVLSTVISVFAGYSLSRFGGRGQQVMGLTLLMSRMLPGSLLVIPLYVVFLNLGLVNTLFALVIINTAFIVPFTTWMLKAFFDGIPREIEEAAFVDGAGLFRTLWTIILPLSGPGIAAAVTYAAVLAWADFLFARTLLTNQAVWPVTQGIASFMGDYRTAWNEIMALGVVSIVPMILLFLATERFLVSSLTAGAVKG